MPNLKNIFKYTLFSLVFLTTMFSGSARAAELKAGADLNLYNSYFGSDVVTKNNDLLTIDTQFDGRNIAFLKFNFSDYAGTELNDVKSGNATFTSATLKTYNNPYFAYSVPTLYLVRSIFSWDENSDFTYADVADSLISTGITGIFDDNEGSLSYNLLNSSLNASDFVNNTNNNLSFALMYDPVTDIANTQSVDIYSKDYEGIGKTPLISFTTAPVDSTPATPEPSTIILGFMSITGIMGFRKCKFAKS